MSDACPTCAAVTTALSLDPSSSAEDVAKAVSALVEAADDARALPLFQRLVERTAAALGLDKEYFDEELQEMCLPSWHDIPERVAALVKATGEEEGKAEKGEKQAQKATPLKRKAPVRKK